MNKVYKSSQGLQAGYEQPKGSEYMLVGGIRTGAHTKALHHESGSGLERINACCGMD